MFGKEKIVKEIKVEGMACMHCSKKVENALKELKEVKKVSVSLEDKTVKVELKENVEGKVLENVIEDLGYTIIK